MPGSKLQRQATAESSLMDALNATFANELSQVVTLLTAKIRGLVKKLETNTNGRIVASQQNLALALRMKADLLKALEDAGFSELALRAVDAPLDKLAAKVLNGAGEEAVSLAAFDVDALVAMKQIHFAELLQVGEDVATQLWRITLDGVLGVRPVLDLVNDIADVLDISAARARTVYDTIVSTYSRQVGQIGTTGEPDEAFLYVGPDDAKTRPFCEEHVDRVYSRAAIDDMDNGQLPNVFLTGGGYSCRHAFRRVSALDTQLLELMDTGVRYQDRNQAAAA